MRIPQIYEILEMLSACSQFDERAWASRDVGAASIPHGIQIMNNAIGFALACTLIIVAVSLIRKIVTNRSHISRPN